MNKTTTTRAAAMLAAATLTTGLATTANADDYIWNVPEGETETIDAVAVANIGAKDLVKTGRGKLVSSAEMAAYTGTITVREGAFEIRTTSDLGTAAGGTVVEDGGTLLVNLPTKDQRFNSEIFTIAGTGDAEYGAAIYQPNRGGNDQNKLFTYIALSDDATICAGTHLGLASGSLSMDGHTLTVKGNGSFTFRASQTPAPVGNLVVESGSFRIRGGSATAGDSSKNLIVKSGSTLVLGYLGDNIQPIRWNLIVQDGGKVEAETSQGRTYYGEVEWNSTVTDGASGPLTFEGNVTGTGTIKASAATLTFEKPLGAGVGLGLSGTATAILPTAKAYTYEHAGLLVGRVNENDAWGKFTGGNVSIWKYCDEGPGPQLDLSYWKKGYWDESPADETISGNTSLGAKGYIWNREATNVSFHVWCRCLYKTYVNIDGTTCFVAKNNNVDTDYEVSIPANSCLPFLSMTAGSGSPTPGPYNSTTGLKINGGPTLRDNGNGWYFTTNAVSGVANPADLPSLSLADDGAIDMNGMPLSVDAVSGAGIVTNTTTLTISNSWTLAAADIADGAKLVVDGALAFGNGCSLAVTDLSNLSTAASYTVASADSIAGIAAAGVEVSDKGRTWKFVLSGDGKSIDLVYVPQATAIIMR